MWNSGYLCNNSQEEIKCSARCRHAEQGSNHIKPANADTRELQDKEKDMDEIILRSEKKDREPISDERIHMLLNYAVGIITEVLGFALAFVIFLCMAGVLR